MPDPQWSLTVVTPPAELPVSMAAAKRQLRVEHDLEDEDIADDLAAATDLAERHCNRCFVTRTVRARTAAFPAGGRALALPVGPVRSVSAVRYVAEDGTVETLDPAGYVPWSPNNAPAVSAGADGWPAALADPAGYVEVEYVAGYGTAAQVPAAAKKAIRLILGHLWADRGDQGAKSADLPPAAIRFLASVDEGGYR